jgi:Helix-turn-helix domain
MKRYEWVEAVLAHSRAEPLDRLVLLALASRANAEGACWPSLADLARRTRLSRRQLQYALQRLEALGELRVVRGRGRGHLSRYYLAAVLAGAGAAVGLAEEKVQAMHLSGPRKGAWDDQKRCMGRPEKVHIVHPELEENWKRTARARARHPDGRARARPDPEPDAPVTMRPLDLFQEALARLAVATGRAPPAAAAITLPPKVDAKA